MTSGNWEVEQKSRTNGANKSAGLHRKKSPEQMELTKCRSSQEHQTQESPHPPGKTERRAEQITRSEASNGDSIESWHVNYRF